MFNANSNDSTNTIAQINWVSLFPALGTAPDARLNSTSTVATTASFMANKFYNLPTPSATLTYTYCAGATATALTATATPRVIEDIKTELGLKEPNFFKQSF